MDKKGYYIVGIFIILSLSVVYVSHMNREVKEKIETDSILSYEVATENYTFKGNQTPIKKIPIKVRGKLLSGKDQEHPIEINSRGNWSINVVFDSNITEKEAKEIISKYYIPKPLFIKRGAPYPRYYVYASRSNFEVIKIRLAEEEYVQLSNKIKITGENVTAVIWVISDQVLPELRSSGIPLKQTMVMRLIYGHETPQTESRNIMQQLDLDEKIINTYVDYLFGE